MTGTTTTTTSAAAAFPLTSGYWTTACNGYGSVTYDAGAGILLSPKASTSPSETHAALTLADNLQPRDFRLSITATTEQQLRLNSPPNPWETFWVFFNYTPTSSGKKTNYFLLKPNGAELGTAYDEVGQTFLQTGPAFPRIPVNMALRAANHCGASAPPWCRISGVGRYGNGAMRIKKAGLSTGFALIAEMRNQKR